MPDDSTPSDSSIPLGAGREPDDSCNRPAHLLLEYTNRHGLVTGATGTGKTVPLQITAEGFSDAGVPVFRAAGAAMKPVVRPVGGSLGRAPARGSLGSLGRRQDGVGAGFRSG